MSCAKLLLCCFPAYFIDSQPFKYPNKPLSLRDREQLYAVEEFRRGPKENGKKYAHTFPPLQPREL
jgi:hypothetical protein